MKVSLCVIALNEEKNIGRLLSDIAAQDYPHEDIEVLLVDGLSTDNTKAIMTDFRELNTDFDRIEILDNPKKIQAAAWNIAINNSRGDVVIRVDAHALIPADFVRMNVQCIKSGETVCGGRRINVIDDVSRGKKLLLMAENSMFGSGVATYRRTNDRRYVKTLAHACYRREVFDQVGLFNEKLLRSEDNELHYRIRKNGYRFCMDGNIYSEYQTRNSLCGMIKQKYGNGKWIGITSKISPRIFSLYHFVPFLFLISQLLFLSLFIIGLIVPGLFLLMLPYVIETGAYILLDILLSVKSAITYKMPLGVIVLPFLFPLLHFAYGLGTFVGFLKLPFVNVERTVD